MTRPAGSPAPCFFLVANTPAGGSRTLVARAGGVGRPVATRGRIRHNPIVTLSAVLETSTTRPASAAVVGSSRN